jgi:hypothetical protein
MPRTLLKLDGYDGGRILFATAGAVFNITAGRRLYEHSLPRESSMAIMTDGLSRWVVREICRAGWVAGYGETIV